jgi:hypothetical protein
MPITKKLDNKVRATTQVPSWAREIQNNALNADLRRNPSQMGMAKPTVPPSHRQSGMDGSGNGPKAPKWPMRQK